MNSATGMKVGEVGGGFLPNGVLRKEAYDRMHNGDCQEPQLGREPGQLVSRHHQAAGHEMESGGQQLLDHIIGQIVFGS
jgi:hypothetical protein